MKPHIILVYTIEIIISRKRKGQTEKMRKEATADLWKMLYDLTDELKELKPWEDLWDMDLIGIQENGREEPVFCSIMGRNGDCFGIGLYDGTQGLASFQKSAAAQDSVQPVDYIMMNQQALICYWGDRIDVPEDQKAMIKQLGRKYRGKNNWPFFLSFQPRFAPWTPDEEEVRLLVETFVQLIEGIKALREERVKVNFEEGEFCFRYFDLQQMNWMTAPARLPYIEEAYETIEVTDEVLMKRLEKQPENGATLLLDTAYLHGMLKDEKFDRPVNPMVLLAVDRESGMILHVKLLSPEEEEGMAAANFLVNYIEADGRPEKVLARNPYILYALDEICEKLSITLNEAPIQEIDIIMEGMRKQTGNL